MIDNPPRHRKDSNMPYIMLINLILLLNTFFIISGTIAKQETTGSLAMPESMNQETSAPPEESISISKEGRVLIDEVVVSDEQLSISLKQYVEKNPGKPVFIKADARLSAPVLFKVMRMVGESGGSEIKLIAVKST